jgi:acetyl/propionyl-CoA carboxylase alpha subunit
MRLRMRENEAVQLTNEELTSLLDAFEEFGLTELALTIGDTEVELRSGDGPPLDTAEPDPIHHVTAPTVGVVRLAPAAVRGREVGPDDILCVLDGWKSSVEVKPGVAGVVRTVEVMDGALAEYGQTVVAIESIGGQETAGASTRSSSSSA